MGYSLDRLGCGWQRARNDALEQRVEEWAGKLRRGLEEVPTAVEREGSP